MGSTAKDAIQIFGAGKVGRALAAALRNVGYPVSLRAARKGLPGRAFTARFVILAVRDRELEPLAKALAARALVHPKSVCVHVAGALGPEPLFALRAVCAGVAQMHPMIPFASLRHFPSLTRGNLHVAGDARAVQKAKQLGRALGMTPRTIPKLDRIAYHAAAGLVANGAAALCALGATLLERANVPASTARQMLGPLLRGVGDNVEQLGFPDALTGPIRRGDPAAVAKHLELLRARLPEALPLYRAAGLAQVPLARVLAEAPATSFDEIVRILTDTI
jgi:predicted short-subunit dehydrogenase-like oxidoreductase (DUF2520 family)